MLALLTACAGAPELRRSGFLDDYSRLSTVPGRADIRVFRASTFQPEKTRTVILEDAVAWFDPDSQAEDIHPEARKKLTEEFTAIMRKTLQDEGYTLVELPGEDVLRVRVAITELYVRFGPLATEADKRGGIKLDGASLEADIKQSLTGETLFAVMTTRRGGLEALSGRPTEAVFRYWANQLVELLRNRDA